MIQTQLTSERIAAMTSAGLWQNRTLLDHLDALPAHRLDGPGVVGTNSQTGVTTRLTYRELLARANRIALNLRRLGVERGDVVSYQLPNWWEFIALHLACLRIGAVTNPVMPTFRHRELTFMLGLAESKVMIVPSVFRGFDHAAMMAEIRPQLPALKHVLVVGGSGTRSFEAQLLGDTSTLDADPVLPGSGLEPNDVMQLLYTSGTTGEPKGALHTSNTILSNLHQVIERLQLDGEKVYFLPSPLAHQAGFAIGMLIPLVVGGAMVLQDIWSPDEALALIERERANFVIAATPFLADVADHPDLAKRDVSSLEIFVSAGAPIPPTLVQRAVDRLKCHVVSAWGMTEVILPTLTLPGDAPDKIFGTDGCVVPGMQIRVVDSAGAVLPAGQEGELQARGASAFVGYLKRPDWYATDAQGWFRTGDLARLDRDGYVRITGRAKDIIIRGGENIPVIEVEQLLHKHPAVKTAFIVGVPDPRLGERAVAYVTLWPGASLSMQELKDHCESHRMNKQYWPEHLVVVDDFPRTPTGKVQKFRLREMAKELGPIG